MARYDNRIIFTNNTESYKKYLQDRGIKKVNHYATAKFSYPTEEQISNLELITHVWSWGDKYYKLAHKYYGDSELWWVIAWFNKQPMEFENELGDLIYVPNPLDRVLTYFGI